METRFAGTLKSPAEESALRELASFDIHLPDAYRSFLLRHDGGVIFHSGDPDNYGVHLLPAQDIDFVFERDDLITFARIPQVGGYMLAFNPKGQVVDCYGKFPVIAASFEDFLSRLTEWDRKGKRKSLYWL